ncbi:hypothetical protein CNMCM6106_000694 [Aspergillus hiratsukae]|uniref:Uncharacterized protein n=1 Tax=Aspergillus hiratsukae TaxID=1194566 RepID=A0A8H6Q0V5_9EURO|nr:hypothetical protein CNMCM6106_000694 [Aspergillus hiratsukae]
MRLGHLYRDDTNLKTILNSIAANIVMPKNPDSTWLKTHFRVENLRTPDASILAAIEHVETRTFLSTVGFPGCSTLTARLTSQNMSHLHRRHFRVFNADIRDVDPPVLAGDYIYIGSVIECTVLFGTSKGDVIFYVFPGLYRIRCEHLCLGSAATSVSSFLVLLGTLLEFRRQIQEVVDLCIPSELQPRLHIYETFLRRVYARMREYGDLPERYDSFWHRIFGKFNLAFPFLYRQRTVSHSTA